jgi:hypothetical protein
MGPPFSRVAAGWSGSVAPLTRARLCSALLSSGIPTGLKVIGALTVGGALAYESMFTVQGGHRGQERSRDTADRANREVAPCAERLIGVSHPLCTCPSPRPLQPSSSLASAV